MKYEYEYVCMCLCAVLRLQGMNTYMFVQYVQYVCMYVYIRTLSITQSFALELLMYYLRRRLGHYPRTILDLLSW